MNKIINLDEIIWFDTNMFWMYETIKGYNLIGKDLEMNYLSLGSLRHDERYFVGYIYSDENPNLSIELVACIQYKILSNKLILNYMETAEKYRGNAIAKKIHEEFSNRIVNDSNIPVVVTTLSHDGKESNLLKKVQDSISENVIETSKRNII